MSDSQGGPASAGVPVGAGERRAVMSRALGDQRGMTVAELMVAVVIIGVALVALASAIPLAAYGIQEGNQLSTAIFLANQRMEQARNASWTLGTAPLCADGVDTLGVSASSSSAPAAGAATTFSDESPLAAPYSGYTRTVRISDVSAANCATTAYGLRQVTVTVSYRPMTGVGMAATTTTKSAVVTMYISQR